MTKCLFSLVAFIIIAKVFLSSALEDSRHIKVKFLLNTRDNQNAPDKLILDDKETLVNFRPLGQTKIIIHGYTANYKGVFNQNVKNAYLEKGDYNVIHVDWGTLAMAGYATFVRPIAAPKVGEMVGDFIIDLLNKNLTTLKKLHLVGHSLGAHISGIAGRKVMNENGKQIGRISGLDPAGVLFRRPSNDRLSPSNAKFVDVIHTNPSGYGLPDPLGHVDFYPINEMRCDGPRRASICHSLAHRYFAVSINKPKLFQAVACENEGQFDDRECNEDKLAFMGNGVSKNTRGIYYLETAEDYPYGQGLLSSWY